MDQKIRILVAASEVSPLVRTSYVADVISSLPQALQRLGMCISLVIPRYSLIPDSFTQECIVDNIAISIGEKIKHAGLYRTTLNNMSVYLVDMPDYYHRNSIYCDENGDYPDNAERFIFFSRAVVELLPYYQFEPDIIHCNDWQTGLIPLYLKRFGQCNGKYRNVKSLFTVHNLSKQGLFWRFDMHLTGLPWSYFTSEGIEFYGDINLLKAGLLYSNAINTVSPRYCKEIQTSEFGCGLEGVLQSLKPKLYGILNGVNYDLWDPQSSSVIPAQYTIHDHSGKRLCKTELLKNTGLVNKSIHDPLIAMISPLYSHKGLDLLEFILPSLADQGIYVILQGVGDRNYVRIFSEMEKRFSGLFRFINNLDSETTQQVIAGSDFLLNPSRFEPCGLNQMYALRFGTMPIVHQTGGLDNTVFDSKTDDSGIQTGFKFKEYSSEALLDAINRGLVVYQDAAAFTHLRQTAMSQDFSWSQSALQYLDLYKKILDDTLDVS